MDPVFQAKMLDMLRQTGRFVGRFISFNVFIKETRSGLASYHRQTKQCFFLANLLMILFVDIYFSQELVLFDGFQGVCFIIFLLFPCPSFG